MLFLGLEILSEVGVENCGNKRRACKRLHLKPEIVPPLWWPVVPGSLVYLSNPSPQV